MYHATTEEASLSRPMGARRAYGQVIRSTIPPRELEYRVFAEITGDLETVTPDMPSGRRGEILGRNRQLWQTLAYAVADDANTLPPSMRASIISISIWVARESSRVLRDNLSLADLIETNRTIMRGLQGTPSGAEPCPSN